MASDYSLLSGASHGEFWALMELVVDVDRATNPPVGFASLSPERTWWLLFMSSARISRNLWAWYQMIGWDGSELTALLEFHKPGDTQYFWS